MFIMMLAISLLDVDDEFDVSDDVDIFDVFDCRGDLLY